MSRLLAPVTLLALFLLPGAVAEEAKTKTPPKLGDVAWIAGHWSGTHGGIEMEEHWIAPKGGLMLGVHRDVRKGGPAVGFEYLRIETRKNGHVYYVASPGGRGETAFKLVEATGTKAVFQNLKHDFPQRIIYTLKDQKTLHARIEATKDGKVRGMGWTWKKN